MATDLEMQLKAKYDDLASSKISYTDFTTWFEQQKWPSNDQTDRMFQAVELTGAHIKAGKELPDDLNRAHLAKIGDYLHGRTDERPAQLGESEMSSDELRHLYQDKNEEYDR